MKDLQTTVFEKIGNDNILHFLAGGWIACLAPTWYYALLIGFAIGLLKELTDKYARKSQFYWKEWLATFLGACITALYMILSE